MSDISKILKALKIPAEEELEEVRREIAVLKGKLGALARKKENILVRYDKQLDDAADQLDKEIPNWRNILIRHVKKTENE